MKVKTVTMELAEKGNFKKLFKLGENTTSKLEFKYNGVLYEIIYNDNVLGYYTTNSRDSMILNFLEDLAIYNNGDDKDVKNKLNHLVEEVSPIQNQQYQTIYKTNELKYLIGLEQNLIKSICIEQKLTYQQLADEIGLSESSLRSAASTNKISKQVEKSIEMYLKIQHLEKELLEANKIKNTLKAWLIN